MTGWQLAQVNIGITVAPLDSAQLADFTNNLTPVNALAEASPGFVWRLKSDDDNATSFTGFGDDRIIINMSVWESMDTLRDFVFRSHHVDFLRRRREFFERLESAFACLWWVPAGHEPTISEAEERLDRLRLDGPSPFAFTMPRSFPPPSADAAADEVRIPTTLELRPTR